MLFISFSDLFLPAQMILKYFLFWRIALFIITYLGSQFLPLAANGGLGAIGPNKPFDYWLSWAQWDGGHYYQIAQRGYFASIEYAFAPLFPILIKIISPIFFGNLLITGLIISNLSFLLFLYLIHKFVKAKFTASIANTTIISLIVFPTTYFAAAYYSESIFLLLAILSFYLLHLKKYTLASLFAGFALLTRFVGIFLFFSLTINYLEDIKFNVKRINHKIIVFFLSLLPFAAYCFYLNIKFADPFYFFTAQANWYRAISHPLTTIYHYIAVNTFTRPFRDYLELFLTLLFLIILLLGHRKIPFSWWLFSFFALIIPVSTGTLMGMPRYLLASFGTFIILAIYLSKTKLRYLVWTISLALQFALATMFINGFWTA